MIFTFFKRIPPVLSVPMFYSFITFGLLFRFLFSSSLGALLLSFSIYYYVDIFTNIEPFDIASLISWIESLTPEYKVAIVSSMVTIMGFIIAFHTATANWQNQMKAQLKSQASNEIENFFSIVSNNITTTSLYTESLIEIVNKIQKGASIEEANFSISYQQEKAKEFMVARDTLSKASVEVHRLISRNYNLLSTGFGLVKAAQDAASSLSHVAEKMWIHIPIVDLENPNHIQSFINQVNITECHDFLDTCDTNQSKITGISGGIQGYLTAPILGFSFTMFANLWASRKDFKNVMTEFYEKLNKNS